MAEPLTFVIDGKLQVQTVLTAEFVRIIWPAWIEGVHWAVGSLTGESRAGRALLAARVLHGQNPDLEPDFMRCSLNLAVENPDLFAEAHRAA